MIESRNPFKIRATEYIESEETFVRLFSPDVLEIFSNNDIWGKPQIIRSAPGGGKSSLLRLFTPRSLLTVHKLRTKDHIKELFRRLQELSAINNNGPLVLGIQLSCANGYAALADIDIDAIKKQRLLLSLINARIVLSALHGALSLKGLSFPKDLKDIQIASQNIDFIIPGLSLPCNGCQLYDWASSIEKSVCDAVDSFDPVIDLNITGHDSLISLRLITAETLQFNGNPIVDRIFLMLDDVHRLTNNQRRFLFDEIIFTRVPAPIWIAERLEALNPEELFFLGSINGRDYDKIYIEKFWQDPGSKRFERVVFNIADRRARDAKDTVLNSFNECLQDSLDGSDWQENFRKGIEKVSTRVRKKTEGKERYRDWILEKEQMEGIDREVAVGWKTLEILIERDQRKIQKSFDFYLSTEELQQRDVSGVRAAAELLFYQEFNIPYYFGFSQIASLSSWNIEQFLSIAGDLFEESISNTLLKKSSQLSPDRQEAIIKKTVKEQWKNLHQRVKDGVDVCRFLESIGKFAKYETEKPSAPYAPGVSGIAITMADRKILLDSKKTQKIPDFSRLADILMSCIAHNLLEIRLDHRQNNQNWMVMYLNRMLCVQFGLPLQYGGWREKSLKDLFIWFKKGFSSPKKSSELA